MPDIIGIGEHLADCAVIVYSLNPVHHVFNALRVLSRHDVSISSSGVAFYELPFFDDVYLTIDTDREIISILPGRRISCLLVVQNHPNRFGAALIISDEIHAGVQVIRNGSHRDSHFIAHLSDGRRNSTGNNGADITLCKINHVIETGEIKGVPFGCPFPEEDSSLEYFYFIGRLCLPVEKIDESTDFQIKGREYFILVRRVIGDGEIHLPGCLLTVTGPCDFLHIVCDIEVVLRFRPVAVFPCFGFCIRFRRVAISNT